MAAAPRSSGRWTTQRLTLEPAELLGSGLARRRFETARLAERGEALAPRGVGQILDAGCDVLRSRFAPSFGVALALWFPTLLVESWLVRMGSDGAYFVWTLVVPTLVQLFTAAFVCSLVGGHLQGRFVPAGEAFRRGLVRFPGIVLLGVLTGGATLLGFCACALPGFALMWLFSLVPAVYVLERVNVAEAIARSIKLVASGSALLRWMGWSIVGGLMSWSFSSLHEALGFPAVREAIERRLALGGFAFDLAIAGIGAPLLAIGTAYLGVVVTVFYIDQRVRREGLDLELGLEALAAQAPLEVQGARP